MRWFDWSALAAFVLLVLAMLCFTTIIAITQTFEWWM